MNAKTLILLLLSMPLLAFGQSNSSIDLITGVEYSYRTLSTSSSDAIINGIMERRDDEETGKLNWRAGFNYNRRISSRLFLKTGARLASVGYKGEKKTGIRWGSEHDGNGGWSGPDPNLPHEIQLIDDYWFIEIPIAGRFEFDGKKLAPFIEAGGAPSIYMGTRTKTVTDIGADVNFEIGKALGFNQWHLVGYLSFGANYDIGQRLQLFGQPIFRYHFTKLADASIAEYLYNVGMEVGVRRRM